MQMCKLLEQMIKAILNVTSVFLHFTLISEIEVKEWSDFPVPNCLWNTLALDQIFPSSES